MQLQLQLKLLAWSIHGLQTVAEWMFGYKHTLNYCSHVNHMGQKNIIIICGSANMKLKLNKTHFFKHCGKNTKDKKEQSKFPVYIQQMGASVGRRQGGLRSA